MTGTQFVPVRIRQARACDIPVLLEIVQSAYRGEGGWTTEAHLVRGHRTDEAEVRGLLEDPHALLLVAQRQPASGPATLGPTREPTTGPTGAPAAALTVLGCCYTRQDPDEPQRAELGLFAVSPSAQGAGVGRALIEAHVARRAQDGVRRIELCVLQNRPELRAWYERRGFQTMEGTLPFPADPSLLVEPGLRMERMVRTLLPSSAGR